MCCPSRLSFPTDHWYVTLSVCRSACHAHIFLPSTQGRTRADMAACCCLYFSILRHQWVNSISEYYCIITAVHVLQSLLFIHIRYEPCEYRIYHNIFEINSYVSISCKSEEKKSRFNFVCLCYWHTLSLSNIDLLFILDLLLFCLLL